MKVEKRIVFTEEEKIALTSLRDKLEYLLEEEEDFIGREDAGELYEALYNFCSQVL